MATSKSTQWTVIVVVDEDASLNTTYQLSPNARLSELMQMWRDEHKLFGNWVFKSIHEAMTFSDTWMTLEMIGETVVSSRIVTLRAELSDEWTLTPVREIFVYLNDKCHHLFVKPHDRIYELLWRLPGEPKCFEYNGLPLDPEHTVQEAGLQNKSVIYESLCSITVKMSSGYTRTFQMPSDNLVLHLKEQIKCYETNEFSLKYQGRYLRSDENIRQLKQTVEVRTIEFVVFVNGRYIVWKTKDEPIPVSQFVSQLAVKGDIDINELETLELVCVGCQRRIHNSENGIQQLPVECCQEMSLTLEAIAPFCTKMVSGTNDVAKHCQILYKHLVQWSRKNSKSEDLRWVCRELNENCAEGRFDYNIIIQCSKELVKRIKELADEIEEIEVSNKILKSKRVDSDKKIDRLHSKTFERMEEIRRLKDKNNKLEDRNANLMDEIKKLRDENEELRKSFHELNDKWEELNVENKKLNEETRKLNEESKKIDDERKVLMEEIKKMMEKPSPRATLPSEGLGVKLQIFYNPDVFFPTSRPEIQQVGRHHMHGYFMKCQISGVRVGTMSFNELRNVLGQLFTGPRIQKIYQYRGFVAGKQWARVTSIGVDDIDARISKCQFCDINGTQYSWEDVGKPCYPERSETGDFVFICNQLRRTVLMIHTE